MDKELKDKLEANGFDVDVTLQRFMNNEKLYFKFLKKLPADQNYVSFGEAINNGEKLRANNMEGVPEALVEFKNEYEKAIMTINGLE